MSFEKMLRWGVALTVLTGLLQLSAAPPTAAQTGPVTDIYVLGRPATTFSPHPPKDLEELKDLFDRFEKDLRIVLEKGGWGGDPDDFFRTIRAAQPGDGTVTRRTVQPGETFQWMAYRKRGQPDVIRNPRWSAKQPLETWQIKVLSGDTEYLFFVPVTCMNLAYDTSRPAPTPSCDLQASFDAAADLITVIGKSDAESFKITSIQIPGGAGSLSDLQSTGAMQWSYRPTADGTYRFNAEATTGRRSASCSATVQVTRAKPVCSLDSTVDPETRMITVDASGSRGEFSLTGVTLPDGSAGSVGELTSVGAQRWSYDPSATLKKKPGSYSYTFSGESRLHGSESTCETVAVITREAPEFRWIARGFYATVWPGSDFATTEDRSVDPPILTSLDVSDGDGFGFDLEYLATPNVGIVFSGIFSSMDAHFMWDRADLWLMQDDDIDLNLFSLGANYHFTPDRSVDFFLGAFVGLVQYDDVDFTLPEIGETVVIDFDDDIGFGLNAGVDIPFKRGKPWLFTAGLRYLLTSIESEGAPRRTLDIDPLIGTVGIGYRF